MLKNKKILFLFLMVVLLLLIPNIVKADERILSNIDVSYTNPKAGQKMLTASDIHVVGDGVEYEVYDVVWYKTQLLTDKSGEEPVFSEITDPNETFEAQTYQGQFYYYKVSFKFKRPDTDIIPILDGQIDTSRFSLTEWGKSVDANNPKYFVMGNSENQGDTYIRNFQGVSLEALKTIDVTVPSSKAGDVCSTYENIIGKGNNSVDFSAYNVNWLKYNSNTNNYENFTGTKLEKNAKYKLWIAFEIPNQYEINKGTVIKVNGISYNPIYNDDFMYGKAGGPKSYEANIAYYIDTTESIFYSILEGKDSTFMIGKDETLTIRIDAPFTKFLKVFLDDEEVDSKNYEAKEGSTVITFKEEYLKTLSKGKHDLKIAFEDGYAISDLTISDESNNNIDNGVAEGKNTNDITKAPGTIPYAGGTLVMILSAILLIIIGTTAYKRVKNLKGI